MMLFRKKHTLSLSQQKFSIEKQIRSGRCEIICNKEGRVLSWTGTIRPSLFSPLYDVKMEYKEWGNPKVFIFGENLKNLENQNFPHHYLIDVERGIVQPCLFYGNEFTRRKLLSETIFPWTVEWLYHYEIWLATGRWHGGGISHGNKL